MCLPFALEMGLFDKVFGKKVASQVTPTCDDDYNRLLNECIAEVDRKNQKLAEDFGLGSFERWDINQEIGELVFSDGGVPKLVCSVTMLGSFSDRSETWTVHLVNVAYNSTFIESLQ